MIKQIFISLCLLVAAPVLAQEKGYIDVSGMAEKRLEAKIMLMGISIEASGEEAATVQQEVLTKSQSVIEFLRSKKFIREITTETLQLSHQNYNNQEPKFSARQRITLKVTDLEAYNSFIVELIESGVTQYHTMGFEVSDQSVYREALIAEAYADALQKARSMAAQAQKEVGEAVIISDQNSFEQEPGLRMDALKLSAQSTSMGDGIMTLRQVVYVRFLLK